MPIVFRDKTYDHTDGNTYTLVLHESLYYGSHMKHSLINPNQIRFNGLDFYDNPDRDEEFYVELYDDLNIPLQFKGTKCTFLLRVMTRRKLENARIFILQVITSGTQNPLISIIFARYHSSGGSSVLSSKYNSILCIFSHSQI